MGEVRTKVKLTNAVDFGLNKRGLLSENEIRSVIFTAVVDTGAVRSVIPKDVLEKLGIDILRESTAEYANGSKEIVGLSEAIIFEIDDRITIEEALVLGKEVLIGQTALEKLDLYIDCHGSKLIPNPEHPDYPITRVY